VQGIVQRQTIENLTDSQGRVYRYQDPESISGRAGLKLQKCFIASKTLRITPYLRASVVQEMLGTNDLSLNNITLSTPYGGTSLMTDGGVTVNLRKNVDIFASGVLVTGSKIDSTGVNGGLRFAW
jgi:outer membrane autotransporter protein